MKFRWGWEQRKKDFSDELQAHLELATAERIARGESPEIARAAALREMGNPPLLADVTRHQWGWQWLEGIWQDLRYALRQLRRSPAYTTIAIATITLAIGANTAVFGLLYAVLLRSLPVEQPDRIVQLKLQMIAPGLPGGQPSDYLPGKIYDDLLGKQTLMSGLCAWGSWPLNLHDANGTRPVPAAMLTGDCFKTLGLHAAVGRLFSEADDRRGGGPEGYAVVLGYDYWRSHLGGDPKVIGRVLDFQDKKGVVVGVLQPGFESVSVGDQPWMYVPSEISPPEDRHGLGAYNRLLFGRMKPGVTPAQVQAQIDPIFSAAMKQEKAKFESFVFDSDGSREKVTQIHMIAVHGRTGSSYLRWEYGKPLYLVEGMVGLSLLVACAYLATLASTRALARRRELAVRAALGAGRGRLAAQLCWESLLLALAGTALGIVFAWGAERVLVHLLSDLGGDAPALHAGPTGMVLLFSLGLTVLTVILAGVGPAWRASRVDPGAEMKEGEARISGRRPRRIGAWLAPVQIALSLVIVLVAGLMATTVSRLLKVDPGFSTSGLTFTRADFSARAKQETMVGSAVSATPRHAPMAIYTSLLDRIRHTPGVRAAAITQAYQLGGSMYMRSASSVLPSGEMRTADMMLNMTVSPGYFHTLEIPLLQGRDFSRDDRQGAPEVCVLSRAAAEFFFPGQNAVGRTITMNQGKKTVQVVGVVGDTLYTGLRDRAPQILYQPYFGDMGWNPYAQFAVRATSTSVGAAAVRNAFQQLAPDVPLDDSVTMNDVVNSVIGRERMVAFLAGFFAVLTLALSAIGIYGLLNYSVVRRRTEIGVRMALGASRGRVVRLVVRDAMGLVFPGLILGAAGAWGATRLLKSLLFGVKPLDPWVCAASVAALLAAALLACALPAGRAAKVQPMEALRFE